MSNHLINWAFKQMDLTGAMKWVLIALANRADHKSRQCYPSLQQIADDAGIERRSVARCLRQLQKAGKISCELRDGRRTVYTVKVVTVGHPLTHDPVSPVTVGHDDRRSQRDDLQSKIDPPHLLIPEPSLTLNKNPPTPQRGIAASQRDEAYETFAEEYREAKRPCEYIREQKDFVWLSKLRKAQHLESKAEPEFWRETCRNYLHSPLPKYTLADLCSRYGVFYHNGLDRYNKPNGEGQTNDDIIRQSSQRVLVGFDLQDRIRSERQGRPGDNGDLRRTDDQAFTDSDRAGDKSHD
jgi:hypothetical protein